MIREQVTVTELTVVLPGHRRWVQRFSHRVSCNQPDRNPPIVHTYACETRKQVTHTHASDFVTCDQTGSGLAQIIPSHKFTPVTYIPTLYIATCYRYIQKIMNCVSSLPMCMNLGPTPCAATRYLVEHVTLYSVKGKTYFITCFE